MLRFCIAREDRNRWRNCIYYDIIGVFDESETLKFTEVQNERYSNNRQWNCF